MALQSSRRSAILSATSALFIAAAFVAPSLPAPAWAQAGGMAGIGGSETVTARATVQSVVQATRHIVLQTSTGETIPMVAGPRVINFDKIKAGDTVVVQFEQSVAYVLSPPNTKLPDSSLAVAGVGAAKGQNPAGAVGVRTVITGLVVGINPGNHTLQMVNPSGGSVQTIQVRSQAGLKNFKLIKVGDTITAVASESLAIALEPAK
jgi:hypothetical protein